MASDQIADSLLQQPPASIRQAAQLLRGLGFALPAIELLVGAALKNLPALAQSLRGFNERVQAFPEAVREGSIGLAKLGWYYDLDIPARDFWDIRAWVTEGNSEAITQYLVEHFERRAPDIEAALLSAHPVRAEPLRQAFIAAGQNLFFVAIPTLLAQADGLSLEILGGKLFKSANKQPEAAKGLADMALDDASLKFLATLQQNSGFNAAEQYAHEFPESPNRHAILHGRDPAYGTRINYLKSLSLLAFVGLHVPSVLSESRQA
ncbi:hypothetical protein [Pelomonas sp. SE-A7]|uniref:hypothetical protein n=1 Tax=Pelomonas sp. SE-A7 TaxID=3054953 RepID=UPI00259CA0B0|nr:hypothetical protein [Pelomonas sp. SE-A7]MDM4768263.1 hypothetical protein [Pelomonas sp. SE-A7]